MKNKILILGLAVVMLASVATAGFPAVAQAAGLTQQQINAVMTLLQAFGADQSVINNVQTALTGGTSNVDYNAFCHTFSKDLTVGNSGPEVQALAQILALQGLGEFDNIFNENVAAGVVQFQAKYGIRQTGYVGPLTRAKLNSLYGCNVVRPPSPQPSITVLSPNGGETYKNDGSSITVNWLTNNVPPSHIIDVIRLRVYPTGYDFKQEYNLATNVLNDGQEVITIPSSIPVGAYTLEMKTYVGETLVMDSSNSYFKIIDVSQPSITVLSPNRGEMWFENTTQVIKWSAKSTANIYGQQYIPSVFYIEALNQDKDAGVYTIAEASSYGSSYSWEVGTYTDGITSIRRMLPRGQYLVRVCEARTTNCDSSDTPFTITSATTTQPSITSPTVVPAAPVVNLSANQIAASDAQPRSYTVTWSATGATSCVLTTNATKDTEDFDFWSGYIGPIQTSGSITAQVYSGATVKVSCTGSGGTTAKSVNLIGNAVTSSLTPEMISAMSAFSQQNNLNTANVLRAVEQLMKAFR